MSMTMEREHTRQQLAQFLWRREGGACVSCLVSTLTSGMGREVAFRGDNGRDLSELCEQAFELASPVPDYDEPVWEHVREMQRHEITELLDEREVEYDGADETRALADKLHEDLRDNDDLERFASDNRIEPYDREVYEHWIVSDWLADKLTDKGEKCDKDFAGLTVWARCTTGQSIALDGVMQTIALNLWPTAEDQARILKND